MIGICTKCKQTRLVVMHHTKGYDGDNKDFVLPYCKPCHQKIHFAVKKSGRCNIPHNELSRKSQASTYRRTYRRLDIDSAPMLPYVRLYEVIRCSLSTGNVICNTYFHATTGKQLYYIEE